MATYNYGSVERSIAVYAAAPNPGANGFGTLFQAPSAPTVCRISGSVGLQINGQLFGFFGTQNNTATGIFFIFNSASATGIDHSAFAGNAINLASTAVDPSGLFSGPGVSARRGNLIFENYVVPPGFFVQYRGGGISAQLFHTITRLETSLT